jgi:hypothetical protein
MEPPKCDQKIYGSVFHPSFLTSMDSPEIAQKATIQCPQLARAGPRE